MLPEGFIYASVYDIKTNLSRYLAMLRRGEARAVIIRRYGKDIAMFTALRGGEGGDGREKC